MSLSHKDAQHQEYVDKFHDPAATYSMSVRDYVLRPTVAAAAIVITLPPVSEAKGRFYSIVAKGNVSDTLTVTIKANEDANANDDCESWEGDIVLYETDQGTLLYSDGLKWMLRTFADIEVEATTRGGYFRSRSATTNATALRARGEASGAAASAYGVHAQGIAYTGTVQATVNALYAEAIAKGTCEVTTLRGAMIAADSEGTPTSIGTMYGAHIRVKTTVTPTIYRALVIEHEKFGANPGVPLNEYIKIIDSVFTAAQTAAAYGLRMLTTGIITTGISLESPMATGMQLLASYSSAGIAVGRNGTPLVMQAAAPLMEIWATSALTTGTFDAAEIHLYQTVAIQTGYVKALRVQIYSDVKTPGSFNAGYFKLDYQTDGYPWGDCAPLSAELVMGNSASPRGLYTVAELQIGSSASTSLAGGGPVSFIHCNAYGTATFVDDNAFLINLDGVTSGATDLFYTNAVAFNNCDAFLKVRVDGTTYYIPLSDNQAGT